MSKRFLQGVRVVLVIGAIAAIAGAASPAGQAKGISYHSLNKIQKRLISEAFAMSLVGAPTSEASDTAACGNGAGGGDEPDEAPSCPPDSYSPAPGPGGGAGSTSGYSPSGNSGCAVKRGNNVKVNQDCLNITDPVYKVAARPKRGLDRDHPHNGNQIIATTTTIAAATATATPHTRSTWPDWTRLHASDGFTRGTRSHASTGRRGETRRWHGTRGAMPTRCQLFDRGNATYGGRTSSSALSSCARPETTGRPGTSRPGR